MRGAHPLLYQVSIGGGRVIVFTVFAIDRLCPTGGLNTAVQPLLNLVLV
jgi:hypothetical protein